MKTTKTDEFPRYCDYSCKYSAFSDPCAVGACRREVGVWCSKANRLHNKHARCLFRPAGEEDDNNRTISD
ncbi:MAG: hypothetical protein IH600_17700 [Bacteroidetes bacterium]|nr:hypothetical protein [Bacteroidota bacterium]